jgi:hypothetical protein
VAAKGATGDMYEQLIAISEMSFAGGHYEVAYHALMAALYWANDLGDVQRIEAVEQLANEQINWIDAHAVAFKHSTQSAALRGNQGIYETLKWQAASMVRMLKLKNE